MSEEPTFVSQTFEPSVFEDGDNARAWIKEQLEAAAKEDVTFGRVTMHDSQKGLLYEGWRVRPEYQGEPRWSLTTRP